MSKILDFSDLLVTKICHDLSGPISAVSNGVEFLEEAQDSEVTKKAMELVHSNSASLINKLKFFRFAYGYAAADGEFEFGDLKRLINNFYENSKIQLHWPHYENTEQIVNLTTASSKLLANLVYLASTTLIGGGEIKISLEKTGLHKNLSIIAISDRLKIHEHIIQILQTQEMVELKLENVQTYLVAKIATDLGMKIETHISSDRLHFEINIV